MMRLNESVVLPEPARAARGVARPVQTLPPPSCRIIVADSDAMSRRIVTRILRNEGWGVEDFARGDEVLARYEVEPPDLLLLAVSFPDRDGLSVCRELQSRHGVECAPIIFLTARNSSADVVAGFDAGATDYVAKPWRDREVVARIRTHLQNRALLRQQRVLVEQLSAAIAAKDRFVSMVAHDLRTPLAAIRGFAEILGDQPRPPDEKELVDLVQSASQSMLENVDELLDFAHLESGTLRLEMERTNVAEMLRERSRLHQMAAERKRITLALPRASPEPDAQMDASLMGRVVDNLLSNAIKYSPLGSTVTVTAVMREGACGFAVRDQGPGIPAHERHLLFREFARLTPRPTAGEKSTGLGLAIVRRIVEAHGGSIVAENLPTGGCEFRVELPAAA